jgi:hypothetical protein
VSFDWSVLRDLISPGHYGGDRFRRYMSSLLPHVIHGTFFSIMILGRIWFSSLSYSHTSSHVRREQGMGTAVVLDSMDFIHFYVIPT